MIITSNKNSETKDKKVTPKVDIKEKCRMCINDLYSDAEDDNEKNIECNECPAWFHVKCTKVISQLYTDIQNKSFICCIVFIC